VPSPSGGKLSCAKSLTDEELQATKLQLIKKKLREVCSTDF